MSESTHSGCFTNLFRFRRNPSTISTNATNRQVVPVAVAESLPAYNGNAECTGCRASSEKAAPVFASCCDFAVNKSAPGDSPPAYLPSGQDDIYRPEVMATIEETIGKLDSELRELSLKVHSHPELMFKEKYAHDTLSSFMAAHGFSVTRHYLGLETAWRAEFTHGSGGRVLGVNSEMDALPGIGHACGHNLIAIAGVGVALAVKAALEKHDVAGKVVLLGTPAEEGGQGKVILLDRGGYKDMDACVMCHPGPGPLHCIGLGSSLAYQGLEVEFFGHTAHAAAAPWEGINAMDATVLAYSNVACLRQQIKPTHRVHGVLKGPCGMAANVIPDYTKMLWYIRAPTWAELEVLRTRVRACFEAAALATSCKYKITEELGAFDLRQNSVLGGQFAQTVGARYDLRTIDAEGAIGGSTDFGNITYAVPGIHPVYSIPTEPNGGNHTPGFTASAKTPAAHEATLLVTKGLALTGFRVLDDTSFFHKVKKAFEEEVGSGMQ